MYYLLLNLAYSSQFHSIDDRGHMSAHLNSRTEKGKYKLQTWRSWIASPVRRSDGQGRCRCDHVTVQSPNYSGGTCLINVNAAPQWLSKPSNRPHVSFCRARLKLIVFSRFIGKIKQSLKTSCFTGFVYLKGFILLAYRNIMKYSH